MFSGKIEVHNHKMLWEALAQMREFVEKDVLAKSVEALHMKTVPAGVRDFIDLRSGNGSLQTSKSVYKGKQSHIPVDRITGQDNIKPEE